MRNTIIEDRVLARVARDVVGWNGAVDLASLAEVALGQAVSTLRALGIAPSPEVTRTIRDDIAAIVASPYLLASARDCASRATGGRPPACCAA